MFFKILCGKLTQYFNLNTKFIHLLSLMVDFGYFIKTILFEKHKDLLNFA